MSNAQWTPGAAYREGWDAATAAVSDPLAERVLIARCENFREVEQQPCTGLLRYHWGQSDVACNTCGGRCGIAVAAWLTVEPGSAEVQAQVQDAAEGKHAITYSWPRADLLRADCSCGWVSVSCDRDRVEAWVAEHERETGDGIDWAEVARDDRAAREEEAAALAQPAQTEVCPDCPSVGGRCAICPRTGVAPLAAAVPGPRRETVEQIAERYGLPVELLNARVKWVPESGPSSASAVPDPRFRDQLRTWLGEHTSNPDGDSWGMWPLYLDRAATSLAVEVQAQVQAAANQRAAEELLFAADMLARGATASDLRTRAAALAQPAQTGDAREAWVLCRPECTDDTCAPDCPGALAQPAQTEEAER